MFLFSVEWLQNDQDKAVQTGPFQPYIYIYIYIQTGPFYVSQACYQLMILPFIFLIVRVTGRSHHTSSFITLVFLYFIESHQFYNRYWQWSLYSLWDLIFLLILLFVGIHELVQALISCLLLGSNFVSLCISLQLSVSLVVLASLNINSLQTLSLSASW